MGLSVDRATLQACPSLRFVVTPTTGTDHLDLQAAHDAGARVLSLKGETDFLDGITSTAELTWALLLALVRRLPTAHHDVTQGHWRREPFLGRELKGLTLGILGYGRLGRMVARYGMAFGMKVRVNDISAKALTRLGEGMVSVELNALLAQSDVLSVHLPLDASTRGFLNQERLRLLPRGAVVLNTARGEVLDNAELLKLLQEGHLAGAAVDVLPGDAHWPEKVPVDADSASAALLDYARQSNRLLITPHIGGYAEQALHSTRAFMVEKFLKELS